MDLMILISSHPGRLMITPLLIHQVTIIIEPYMVQNPLLEQKEMHFDSMELITILIFPIILISMASLNLLFPVGLRSMVLIYGNLFSIRAAMMNMSLMFLR